MDIILDKVAQNGEGSESNTHSLRGIASSAEWGGLSSKDHKNHFSISEHTCQLNGSFKWLAEPAQCKQKKPHSLGIDSFFLCPRPISPLLLPHKKPITHWT